MTASGQDCEYPQRGDAGYSIIEMLVGLMLFALIMVLILDGIRGGKVALERAAQSDSESGVVAVQSLLRNLLSEARPIPAIEFKDKPPFVFAGGGAQLNFVSSYTVQGQAGGIYINNLVLAPGAGASLSLVLRQRLHRPALNNITNSLSPATSTVILENVTGLSFRYFGQPSPTRGPTWSGSWASNEVIPQLVEMNVTFGANDTRTWRQMVVPLAMVQ